MKIKKRREIFFIAGAVIPVLLFFRPFFTAVLPFLTGFLAACALHGPARKISEKFHIRYRVAAVGLTVLSVSVLMGLAGVLIWRTVSELGGFARETLNGENPLMENLFSVLQRLGDGIAGLPFFSGKSAVELKESILQTFSETARNMFVSAASRFPAFAGKLVSAIPQIFIFCVITVLSAVYFCMDFEKVSVFFRSLIPMERRGAVDTIRDIFKRTAFQFLKSYLVLFLLTFAGLFLGFVILGERYAFLFALMTAAIDALPIFGMGIVMLPLAVFHFMTGSIGYGVGVLVLYLILMVCRQILEPKILGAGLGIHPLIMLCTMYAGWQWFGVFGMLMAPFLTVTVKNLLKMRKAGENSRKSDEMMG